MSKLARIKLLNQPEKNMTDFDASTTDELDSAIQIAVLACVHYCAFAGMNAIYSKHVCYL